MNDNPWPRLLLALFLCPFWSLTALPLAAQAGMAVMTARATVVRSLVVTGQRNLNFRRVAPGVPEAVPVTAADAGRFRVRGERNAPVILSFTLPANLNSGTNRLPIDSWTGRWNTVANPAGGSAFVPGAGPVAATFSGAATGQLFAYLGARVVPAPNQPAGNYAATVTLTVAYP